MPKIETEITADLARHMQRMIRDGWFADENAIVREALAHFVEAKSYLGDSPRMLHRFAADALNESQPETALKFVDRGLSLLATQKVTDLNLYQVLIELRVQILLILNRSDEARSSLEEAREQLPNNPSIARWLEKVKRN